MPPIEPKDLIGSTLDGRYVIERRLGAGGMASVYLGFDLELNRRPVVLKFPDAAGISDATFRQRFLFEIRSLSSLEHPHIIKIFDAGEYREIPYAVVQYAGGGDLKERLAAGPSTPREVLTWFHVVAEALDFVHRHGYCHRDVKPANIFLDAEGYAYLSDFGIATAMGGVDPEATLDYDSDLTMEGFFVGSPRYGPPEAVRRLLSPAYDQYSLAVTVYEAISSEVPVHHESALDLLMIKSRVEPRDIRELLPDLPDSSAAALMRALSIDPEERFASCAEFYAAFAAGLADAERAPRWPAVLVGIAATAAGAALIAWLMPSPDRGPVIIEREVAPLVVTSLHRVETGSTRDEFVEALALCRRYDRKCDESWFAAETLRKVVIAPYALDLHEASAREFAAFIDESGHVTTAENRGHSYHRYVKVPGLDWRNPGDDRDLATHADYPVVHVSWSDAVAFCAAAGMRLPTEDEWEFAARGDEKRTFPWGDAWEDERASWGHADLNGLEPVRGHAVGATPLGHEHMAGNVAEWTASAADGDRIVKGGSWQEENPARLRASVRSAESPDYSSSDLGFRCLREADDDEVDSGDL